MWVADVNDTVVDGNDFSCIHIEAINSHYSCRRHDIFDDTGNDKEGCIKLGKVGRTKKVVAFSMAASLRGNLVGCIRFNLEDHVTGIKIDFSIGIGSNIVQKWMVSLMVAWVSLMVVAAILLRAQSMMLSMAHA